MIIGPHVNRNKVINSSKRPLITEHINKAIQVANEYSLKIGIISIFVGSPRARIITLTNEEQVELKKYIKKSGIRVIAHSSYAAVPWSGNPEAIEYIKQEIKVCINASIEGIVLHLPKKDPSVVIKYLKKLDKFLLSLKNYSSNSKNLNHSSNFTLYLETPAFVPPKNDNQPKLDYSTPENLNKLFALIKKELEYKHYSLCIDTAHLWVAGEDMQSYEGAKKWFTGIKIKNQIIIHLNDSARAKGTGPDKHAALTKGKIWNKEHGGLSFILEYAKKQKIPLILERPNNDMLIDDYKLLKKV